MRTVDSSFNSVIFRIRTSVKRNGVDSTRLTHFALPNVEVDRYASVLEDVHESQNALLDETKAAHSLLIELQSVLITGGDDSDISADSQALSESAATNEQV